MGSEQNQKALMELCRRDIFAYIDLFVWQYNPRKMGREIEPFITWDFQRKAVRTLLDSIECHCGGDSAHQHDLLWEKSREMGATWLFLIVADWLCRFHKSKQILMISRSEEAVESESPDCLFWKIDFMHRYLPDWMRGRIRRMKRYIGYEDTGSSITGEASTGRAGVGGRATVMFIDEFSQIKEDREVLHRTSDTTGCRIFNGTHKGTDTAFYELSQRQDMRKFQMHWSEHPGKRQGLYYWDHAKHVQDPVDKQFEYPLNFRFVTDGTPTGGPYPGLRSPWYDEQCRRKGSARAIAMDLDIDPKGSVSQFFDPIALRQLKAECMPALWEGDLEYDKDIGRPVRLVERKGGLIKLWIRPDKDGKPPKGKYAFGADISTGAGATPSCLSGMDTRRGEKILEYSNANIEPTPLAPLIVALCWLFQDEGGQGARLAWEIPGPGQMLGKRVIEMGYRNVYYRTAEHALNQKVSDMPGWANTPQTKLDLLEEYRNAIQTRQLVNRSEPALRECLDFRYAANGYVEHSQEQAKDNPAGARVSHGDLVMADALMWKMGRGHFVQVVKEKEEELQPLSLEWRRRYWDDRRKAEEAEAWA